MTQHVRTSYRNHRKTTWALAFALIALIAAVVIPIASGGGGKTYTLTATPSATCASPASTVVTIKNTGSPQSLGSAEIYFPPNTVASTTLGILRSNTTSSAQSQNKDIVAIDGLNLAPGVSRQITVTFKAGVTFNTTITAAAKQANRFNDSSGTANLFDIQGSFPTLKIVTCVTVSGRVFQDRNLDNTYTTGQGAFLNSDVPKAWNVNLYGKDVGTPATSYTLVRTTISSSADGAYTLSQVPTATDYKVCVTARGTDASSKWALQLPTGNTDCAPISTGGPTTAANPLPNLSADAPNQDFQVVPVVGPFGGDTDSSTAGGYTVDASSNSDKADAFYVQDTWTDSLGRTNFRFSPITACTPPNCPSGKIYLLETLTADVPISGLGGKQVAIRYDDAPPFLDADLKPMPYCLIDPRHADGTLTTSGVLGTNSDGSPATSCIVTGSQTVDVSTGKVHTVYTVYTSYDGGRQVG